MSIVFERSRVPWGKCLGIDARNSAAKPGCLATLPAYRAILERETFTPPAYPPTNRPFFDKSHTRSKKILPISPHETRLCGEKQSVM